MSTPPAPTTDFKVENTRAIRRVIGSQIQHVRELLAGPLARINEWGEPKRSAHPLVQVLDGTERWLNSSELLTTRIEGYSLEAAGLGPLIDARQEDPALPGFISEMVDEDQYLHNVGVLGVAYAMDSVPETSTVGLIRQKTPGVRIADLRVTLSQGGVVEVEAKAPRALRQFPENVTPHVAQVVVENALSEAAHPITGQLPRDGPGLVAIASHGLSAEAVQRIDDAARIAIQRFGPGSPNLIGLLTLNFYRRMEVLESNATPQGDGTTRLTRKIRLTWGNERTLAKNAAYRGGVNFNLEEGHEPARQDFDLTLPDPSETG
jgi:hypothetical protein